MTIKIKNEFKYKLLGIILYLIINTVGLSILFLFSPRNLLFNENSKIEKIKLNLYKDFAKNIYDNINTPLIKNLTLTNDNESCPPNFEKLYIKNQYHGNFSKFYGNKSICIERFHNNEYTFKNLLKTSDYELFRGNKKKCGQLIKDSNLYVYFPNDSLCPLNNIEINSISRAKYFGNYYYQMGSGDQYLTPIYGNNVDNPVIINIDIINNYKVCLEKHEGAKNLPCEFPDNNECFIIDNYEKIYNLDLSDDDSKLNAKNLVKWNYPFYEDKVKFCNPNLKFYIFSQAYVNFTDNNLKEFEEEFPQNDLTNNPLHKAYKAYKSPKNIDRFFCLISIISFVWSLIQFILQTILYMDKYFVRKIYIINGIILFIFKLLSIFGMIINYYCFLNKVQKVYLIMIDKPRNKVLEYYYYSRKVFIYKMSSICITGIILIFIDFIIFTFTYIIKWGVNFRKDEAYINKPSVDLKKQNCIKDNYKIIGTNETNTNTKTNTNQNPYIKSPKVAGEEEKIIELKYNKVISTSISPEGISKKSFIDYSNKVTLKFICKNNITKSYLITAEKDKTFNSVVKQLIDNNPELKEMKMKVFYTSENIINKEITINENNISSYNNVIYIQS